MTALAGGGRRATTRCSSRWTTRRAGSRSRWPRSASWSTAARPTSRGTSYATFDELLHYCRCVAGSIGRLSLGVFGARDPSAAAPLADALGVALQLTNILRDIREDSRTAGSTCPRRTSARFGCSPATSTGRRLAGDAAGRAGRGSRPSARAAGTRPGLRLLPMLDRRSAASAGAMAGIYRRLLERIAAAPAEVLQRPALAVHREKVAVAAGARRTVVRAGPRTAPRVPGEAHDGSHRIVVVGGGLAGITAAMRCARGGPTSPCSRPGRGWAARPTPSPATAWWWTTASTSSCAAARRIAACSLGWA